MQPIEFGQNRRRARSNRARSPGRRAAKQEGTFRWDRCHSSGSAIPRNHPDLERPPLRPMPRHPDRQGLGRDGSSLRRRSGTQIRECQAHQRWKRPGRNRTSPRPSGSQSRSYPPTPGLGPTQQQQRDITMAASRKRHCAAGAPDSAPKLQGIAHTAAHNLGSEHGPARPHRTDNRTYPRGPSTGARRLANPRTRQPGTVDHRHAHESGARATRRQWRPDIAANRPGMGPDRNNQGWQQNDPLRS